MWILTTDANKVYNIVYNILKESNAIRALRPAAEQLAAHTTTGKDKARKLLLAMNFGCFFGHCLAPFLGPAGAGLARFAVSKVAELRPCACQTFAGKDRDPNHTQGNKDDARRPKLNQPFVDEGDDGGADHGTFGTSKSANDHHGE